LEKKIISKENPRNFVNFSKDHKDLKENPAKFIKIIKTCKGIMRLLIIKKTHPDQWRRIIQLDGTCNNKDVLEDVKSWMPFLLRIDFNKVMEIVARWLYY
jgi:hypothetical protein